MLVTVKDAICGHGKTTEMLEHIRDSVRGGSEDLFLYITPYLEQCHDIAGTSWKVGDEEKAPLRDSSGAVVYKESEGRTNLAELKFKHPDTRNSAGTKQESLRRLMSRGEHIVSTHNLFLNMKLDTLENAHKFTLVIDECLDVFERKSFLPEKEVRKLLQLKILKLQEDGITLIFDREKFGESEGGEDAVKDTRYEELAVLCDNNQVMLVNGGILIWEFSAEILKKFKKVYILSYLFEGREMSVYLKKHNIDYEVVKSGKGGKDIAHLVDILEDDKLNAVGDGYWALSASSTRVTRRARKEPERKDYDTLDKFKSAVRRYESYMSGVTERSITAQETNEALRKNLHTVFATRWKTKADDRYFTCISENKAEIAGKNYKNGWLAFSTKATNTFRGTHHVAFLVNVFMHPHIKQVCDSTDYEVDEDLVALSHLIQFIFRSALRCGEPIKVYIPSERMRNLLKDYLNGGFD